MELKHNQKVQQYIDNVCSQVGFRDIHGDVSLELRSHIQEIAEEYIAQGMSENEAIDYALAQMGDADTIGKQLHKVHKPKPEWSVLLFSLLLTGFGLLAIYFIQRESLLTYNALLFEKSLFFSFISLVTIIGLYFFNYRKLEKYSRHLYLAALFTLIFTVLGGIELNGNKSWLLIGPLSINFVAISPLLFTVALAGIFKTWDWQSPMKRLQALHC